MTTPCMDSLRGGFKAGVGASYRIRRHRNNKSPFPNFINEILTIAIRYQCDGPINIIRGKIGCVVVIYHY